MSKTIRDAVIMCGNWQFSPHVTEADLVALAQEFADGSDGDRYLDLHVRRTGDECFCLGFKYRLEGDDRRAAHKHHFHKMRHIIKDRFGKGTNWSVSSPTTIIKQVGL
mgnify:CR=1 FL=1